MKLWHRDVFEAATHSAHEVLMGFDVGVEAANCSWRTDFANQVLAFEKLQRAIDGRLRQSWQLLAQLGENRVRGGVGEIFSERPVDRESLGSNADAANTALPLKLRAPVVYFDVASRQNVVAFNSHVRIIII